MGTYKPHHPFPNLALGERSSANLPRPRSQGGGQGWLTCPVRQSEAQMILPALPAFYAMRGTYEVTKGKVVTRRASHCVPMMLAVVWSKGTSGGHRR